MLSAIINRYKFQHYPDKVPDADSESVSLRIGQWQGVQIDDLSAYNDGVIAAGRVPSDVLEAFVADVYAFIEEAFGTTKVPLPGEVRHYESAVVVQMDPRATSKFDFLQGLYRDLEDFRVQYGESDLDYALGGLQIDTEQPDIFPKTTTAFRLERRASVPWSANYWYSAAALKTEDHLAVLQNLENQLTR